MQRLEVSGAVDPYMGRRRQRVNTYILLYSYFVSILKIQLPDVGQKEVDTFSSK